MGRVSRCNGIWGSSCTLPTYLVPRQFAGSVNTVPLKRNPITLALTLCSLMAASSVVILLIGLHGSGKSTFTGKVIGADIKVSADGGLSSSKFTSLPASTGAYLLASPCSAPLRWTTVCLLGIPQHPIPAHMADSICVSRSYDSLHKIHDQLQRKTVHHHRYPGTRG